MGILSQLRQVFIDATSGKGDINAGVALKYIQQVWRFENLVSKL